MCGLERDVPRETISDVEAFNPLHTVDHESLIDCIAALRVALRKAIRGHVGVDVKQ